MTARHSLASTYLPNLLLFKILYLWRYLLFQTIFLNLKNSLKTNNEHIIILVNSLFRSRIGLITHGQVSGVSSSASWLDSGRYQKKRSPRQAIQRGAGMLYFTIWTRALGSTSAHAVSTLLIQSLYPRLRESADRETTVYKLVAFIWKIFKKSRSVSQEAAFLHFLSSSARFLLSNIILSIS
jgi:hypothetical protein